MYVDDIDKLSNRKAGIYIYIVLYADDILLLLLSVSKLQNSLAACENELDYLDMNINIKKACCICIGSRNDKLCANYNYQK